MINDYPKIEKKPLKVKGCKYDPKKYPTYDNYMAINVDKCNEIPIDYDGVIGVPITILNYLFSDGKIHANIDGFDTKFDIVKFRKGDDDKDLSVNGYTPYFRILIRKVC